MGGGGHVRRTRSVYNLVYNYRDINSNCIEFVSLHTLDNQPLALLPLSLSLILLEAIKSVGANILYIQDTFSIVKVSIPMYVHLKRMKSVGSLFKHLPIV